MTDNLKTAVYQCLSQIPKGCVTSYGAIASRCGYAGYHRQVAKLLSQLPSDTTLPWHRVIKSNGHIAFKFDSSAYLHQQQRLALEGHDVNGTRIIKPNWW